MEREIKFRAWNTNNSKMYFDVQNGIDLGLYIGFGDAMTQINLKVMQYTGLKDKNGKEIYEGDIVRSETYSVLSAVEWDYERWKPFEYYMSLIEEDFEIIGNVYENSDLLTKAKT